jgi:hypothetical protein
MPDEDEEREARSAASMLEQAKRAIAVRSKDREFHGLEREFMYAQSEMLIAFEKSKDVKHPRDVGDIRESILRKFLSDSGYLPNRYAVSRTSIRVASTTGHISKEMDILLYDPVDSIRLMGRESSYEVFPIESAYGVIQVKSRLNRDEIRSGLDNLASFKRLKRQHTTSGGFYIGVGAPPVNRGFGVLFAYDSDLKWMDIITEVEDFASKNPNSVWCNAVVILNRGIIIHGEENTGKFDNAGIDGIKNLRMFGMPDRQGQCLFQFHSILLYLLKNTSTHGPILESYFRLPLVSETLSYEFAFGAYAEFSTCQEHGDYQRKISPENLSKLIKWCETAEPINWIRATDIAYGRDGDNEEAYARQPGDVRIYNPNGLPLSEILVRDADWSDSKTGRTMTIKCILPAGAA